MRSPTSRGAPGAGASDHRRAPQGRAARCRCGEPGRSVEARPRPSIDPRGPETPGRCRPSALTNPALGPRKCTRLDEGPHALFENEGIALCALYQEPLKVIKPGIWSKQRLQEFRRALIR